MDPRIESARRVAACFASYPRMRAAILGGSAARGEARDDSDIDVGIFWSQLPSDGELDALGGLTVQRRVANVGRFDGSPARQFGDLRT